MRERWTSSGDGPKPAARFVACFDVLGFKRMVESTPLQSLSSSYEDLLGAVERSRVTDIRTSGGRLTGLDHWHVPHAVFSDTLLFWSDPEPQSAGPFFNLCAGIVCAALSRRMPLRGGIAYGEAIMDRATGTYLGMALVNAHLTEACQDWVGVGFHESCSSTNELVRILAEHEDVVAYAVPVKKGPGASHALLWHQHMIGADDILVTLQAAATIDAKAKYTNAIAFVRSFPLR